MDGIEGVAHMRGASVFIDVPILPVPAPRATSCHGTPKETKIPKTKRSA